MPDDNQSQDLNAYLAAMQEQIKQLQATVMQQNIRTHSERPIFKPVRPDTFSGRHDKSSVEAWLFQLRQYFETCKMKGSVQVSFAASLLRDDAAIWWRNHVEQSDIGQEILIENWKDFKTALIEQFKPVNSRKIARDKLAKLKQSRSVQEYATIFRSLVLEIIGISEDEKVDRFI